MAFSFHCGARSKRRPNTAVLGGTRPRPATTSQQPSVGTGAATRECRAVAVMLDPAEVTPAFNKDPQTRHLGGRPAVERCWLSRSTSCGVEPFDRIERARGRLGLFQTNGRGADGGASPARLCSRRRDWNGAFHTADLPSRPF